MKTKERKTVDEYEIQSFWGSWEVSTHEENLTAARNSLRDYRTNQPQVAHKIVKKRVRKSEGI